MNISLCSSTNTGESMCGNPQENFAYVFVPVSPAVLFVLLGWFVRWEVSGCTAAASMISSKQHTGSFFSKCFVKLQVVLPYYSSDAATVWKNSHFISSERLNFHKVDNLLIAVHAFSMHMLALLFRVLLFNAEMTPPCFKYMIVISEFT